MAEPVNGFVELVERIDSAKLCNEMPLGLGRVMHVAKERPTTRAALDDGEHLLERCFYLGKSKERVFVFVTVVERKTGLEWFAVIAAPIDGDVNNPLLPLADWSPALHTQAVHFRREFAKITEFAESDDGEFLIFRGPVKG